MMLNRLFMPYSFGNIFHLSGWTADDPRIQVTNDNYHAIRLEADAGKHWPAVVNALKCDVYAQIGISGIAGNCSGKETVRGRLADAARHDNMIYHTEYGEPIVLEDGHTIIDPSSAFAWAHLLENELGEVLTAHNANGVRPVKGVFLDSYGDLAYFRARLGLPVTDEHRDAWRMMLREVYVRIGRACKKWGIGLIVNGDPLDCRHLFTGRMFENIPNQPTWLPHLKGEPWGTGIEAESQRYDLILVPFRGALYNQQSLALSMLLSGTPSPSDRRVYFAARGRAGEPEAIAGGNVGYWMPLEDMHWHHETPLVVYERRFREMTSGRVGICRAWCFSDWRGLESELPWEQL